MASWCKLVNLVWSLLFNMCSSRRIHMGFSAAACSAAAVSSGQSSAWVRVQPGRFSSARQVRYPVQYGSGLDPVLVHRTSTVPAAYLRTDSAYIHNDIYP